MNQVALLKDLIEKRRRKFWEYKNTPEKDWTKKLLQLELDSLNKRIEYLEWRIAKQSDYPPTY